MLLEQLCGAMATALHGRALLLRPSPGLIADHLWSLSLLATAIFWTPSLQKRLLQCQDTWFASKRESLCIAVMLLPSTTCAATGWQSHAINATSCFCCCSCGKLIHLSFLVTRHSQGASPKTAAVMPPLHSDAVEKTWFATKRIPSAMPAVMTLLYSDNIADAVWASTCHLLFLKNATAMLPLCHNTVEEQPKASPSVLTNDKYLWLIFCTKLGYHAAKK